MEQKHWVCKCCLSKVLRLAMTEIPSVTALAFSCVLLVGGPVH